MELARGDRWQLGKVKRSLPIYFPSVSSVKTNLAPIDYVRVLNRVGEEQYLVSAYDVVRCDVAVRAPLVAELHNASATGNTILMDSGNYESYWKQPHQPWTLQEFHEALGIVKPAIAFGFDDQEPPTAQRDYLRQLNVQHVADRTAASGTAMVPIVHGDSTLLAQLCPALVRDQDLSAIAVPERSLGAGILERMKAVRSLRHALDETGRYIILHLLGTGNPISLALYANAGADSFDGLEWCRTVVDHETAQLHHFSQADFFNMQTKWRDVNISYIARTLAHNLEFYRDWMRRLVNAMATGNGEVFCRHNLPRRIFVQCIDAFGWEEK
jgi:hypothetical protein